MSRPSDGWQSIRTSRSVQHRAAAPGPASAPGATSLTSWTSAADRSMLAGIRSRPARRWAPATSVDRDGRCRSGCRRCGRARAGDPQRRPTARPAGRGRPAAPAAVAVRERGAEVDGGRGLADAALLVAQGDDAGRAVGGEGRRLGDRPMLGRPRRSDLVGPCDRLRRGRRALRPSGVFVSVRSAPGPARPCSMWAPTRAPSPGGEHRPQRSTPRHPDRSSVGELPASRLVVVLTTNPQPSGPPGEAAQERSGSGHPTMSGTTRHAPGRAYRSGPRTGMGSGVHLAQRVDGHEGVDLRGGHRRVAEQLLHDSHVGPAVEEVGGEACAAGCAVRHRQ